MAIPHPSPPGTPSMRRRRTLADFDILDRGTSTSPHPAPVDSYASCTGLDESAVEKSPLSPRLSLRAEMEDRGKPPRGRRVDRTPPNEPRSKRRRRLTEFTQDKLLVHDYVTTRKRWISVFLVWVAIVCAIIIAVWLRLASISDEQDGAVDIDAADDTRAMPWENDAWKKVAMPQVFGVDNPEQSPSKTHDDAWSERQVF